MRAVAVSIMVFLAVSLVPFGCTRVERPSGKRTFLLTLDVCNHGNGGLAGHSMPFIPVFANKVSHMDFANYLEKETQDFKPLLFAKLRKRPPKIDFLS